MKNTIFTYYNFQINLDIPQNQQTVIEKLTANTGIDFNPLFFNAADGEIYPDQVIDYALNQLFYVQGYDNVLILDIDCIPLSLNAIEYVLEKASNGVLIGNVQRSHYIENNEHLFIGSSCLCLNRNVFEKLGKPKFHPTTRGDIAEELMYIAEQQGLPFEFLVPSTYETSPYGSINWSLKGDLKPYGIGTTFVRQDDLIPMFYHLFESRTNLHVDKFINKCKTILDT